MARMLDLGDILELIDDGFNDRPVTQQGAIRYGCHRPRGQSHAAARLGLVPLLPDLLHTSAHANGHLCVLFEAIQDYRMSIKR